MQKLIQRLAFAALIISGSAFASGDLLSQATDGAVTTVKAEATTLSQNEMKEVKGGTNSGIYAAAFTRYITVTRYYTPMQSLSANLRIK